MVGPVQASREEVERVDVRHRRERERARQRQRRVEDEDERVNDEKQPVDSRFPPSKKWALFISL